MKAKNVASYFAAAHVILSVCPAVLAEAVAQSTNTSDGTSQRVQWSAFADTYYSHDWNSLPTRDRPYTTQPFYNDELAVNLGFVDVKLSDEDVRGRVAAQYGSSVIANYASEPDTFWRYIQESYVGYRLAPGLWFDTGIFLSHIGNESWISRDNWTYSRSLIADYSPYYQSGARLSYQVSDKLSTSVHLLNGWQNISGKRDPALGTQVSYAPDSSTSFTYNTFVGEDHGLRFFNDLIAKHQLSENLNFALSYDVGFQQQRSEGDTAVWHGWAFLTQYKITPAFRVGGRVERYADPHQIVLTSLSQYHVAATGLSINFDYDLTPSLLWRTEYRVLLDDRDVFPRSSGFSDNESFLVTSLAYSWSS